MALHHYSDKSLQFESYQNGEDALFKIYGKTSSSILSPGSLPEGGTDLLKMSFYRNKRPCSGLLFEVCVVIVCN